MHQRFVGPALGSALSLAFVLATLVHGEARAAEAATATAEADRLAAAVQPEVIANRRWLHQHPELSNREVETAKYVATKLRALGYEVRTGIAFNGVVGVLRGGRPGPVVALRSDMDALPVAEQVDLPFASKVKGSYDGKDVGVMHACGHDTHMAMLLGAAKVFAQMREQLPGTVKLIFQPAEEGAPKGERGGAELMVAQGVLSDAPAPEAIFGLHVMTEFETGTLGVRAGGLMASADNVTITVHGRQTHGALPWNGVDPIVVGAQIVLALQTIVSRQVDITRAPAIVTIGKFDGGVRDNIVPETVTLKGTLRALYPDDRELIRAAVRRTATKTAEAAGASAEVEIGDETAYPVTYNDPALTAKMMPTLIRLAGRDHVLETLPKTVAEDFSFYQQKIPGLFVFVGVRKPGASTEEYAPNHSPRFKVDEAGLELGTRTLVDLALDYMKSAGSR